MAWDNVILYCAPGTAIAHPYPKGVLTEWTSKTSEAQSSEKGNRKSPLLNVLDVQAGCELVLAEGALFISPKLCRPILCIAEAQLFVWWL